MQELFRRLAGQPLVATELVLATFFANLLALASTLFVIQVLNRYVAHGVGATLVTLVVGVIAAIVLEVLFRHVRMILARGALSPHDEGRAIGAFGLLVTAKWPALMRMPAGQRRQTLRGLDTIENTYSPANVATVMDVPFAVFLILALALLSPTIGAIAAVFGAALFAFAVLGQRRLSAKMKRMSDVSAFGHTLASAADRAAETIRAFGGHDYLMRVWRRHVSTIQALRQSVASARGHNQNLTYAVQAVMGVAVIAVGATLVVASSLDVGTLIGCNVLAARAIGPIVRFAQLGDALARADEAERRIRALADLPVERDKGAAPAQFKGAIEFREVAFGYGAAREPLFESLSFRIAPGSVLMATGRNGSGKTTLARLLVGLVEPTRGQVLVDGIDLRQADPRWWRKQICYMPQEPTFLPGTLRDNLKAVNPTLDDEGLAVALRAAGLSDFLDASAKGLDLDIGSGEALALGIRRRLALARALVTGGRLAIFDEPTDSLDAEGCAAVYAALKDLATRGATVVVFSHDPVILRGARAILDLNLKPVPRLLTAEVGDATPAVDGSGPRPWPRVAGP